MASSYRFIISRKQFAVYSFSVAPSMHWSENQSCLLTGKRSVLDTVCAYVRFRYGTYTSMPALPMEKHLRKGGATVADQSARWHGSWKISVIPCRLNLHTKKGSGRSGMWGQGPTLYKHTDCNLKTQIIWIVSFG
jgi:hypothetical protein